MKRLIRVAALFIMILLCASSVFSAVGYAYADPEYKSSKDEGVEWYVRMTYPYKRGANALGHYDLQLIGNYTFDDISYTDPVFSYGKIGGRAYLDIFNASDSKAYYRRFAPFKAYICNRTTSSSVSQYLECLALIADNIDESSRKAVTLKNASGKKVGTAYRYKVTSSFKNYDKSKRNCFTAVGLWTYALGDDHFISFAASHPYRDYTAYAMIHDYPSTWTPVSSHK